MRAPLRGSPLSPFGLGRWPWGQGERSTDGAVCGSRARVATDHGVPQRLVDDTFAVAQRFFARPEPDKLAL